MSSDDRLDELVKAGKLRPQTAEAPYLNDLLEAARRNFEAGRLLQGRVHEAAFKLYYDGLLQVSRAVLLLAGLRPDDGEQHKTTFLAAGLILGAEFDDLINRIQRFRIKRNSCIYEPTGVIGESEAEEIHRTTRSFWAKVKDYLRRVDPQLKLFRDF